MIEKTAYVEQLHGLTFAARMSSNHWVMMDSKAEVGGSGAASSPKELILAALAGCTGSDVASILQKKRVKIDVFTMHLTAQETQEHPKIFSSIHVEFVFKGENIQSRDVERAIELSSTKYCSVSAMLKPTVKITTSYRIENREMELIAESEDALSMQRQN